MVDELGMVNDVCGYFVMLPREWYLRGVLGFTLINPKEERGFGFACSERSSILELDIL